MFQRSRWISIVTGIVVSTIMGTTPANACTTDLDGSGATDVGDLLVVLGQWGPCPGCAADFDGDNEVAVGDLLAILSEWGLCQFKYPDHENDFIEEIAVEQLGLGDPLTVPQDLYDRFEHDITTIWALRPEIEGGDHIGDWVPKQILVVVDLEMPDDDYLETVDFYQAEIIASYFDGLIELVEFPEPVNMAVITAVFAALPQIESAEPNSWIQLPAGTPRYAPTDIGGGALEWSVIVGWWSDGEHCEFGFLCDCFTTYQFVSLSDGSVTLLDLFTQPYAWAQGADCSDLPPGN